MLAYFDSLYNAFRGQNFVIPSATFIADIIAIISEKGDQHLLLNLPVLQAKPVKPQVIRKIASMLFKFRFMDFILPDWIASLVWTKSTIGYVS